MTGPKPDSWMVRAARHVFCWPPQTGLATMALLASIGGTVALTFLLNRIITRLTDGDGLLQIALGLEAIIGISFISFGLVVGGKRAIELEFWKLKAKIEAGDDDAPDSTPSK